MTVVDRLYFQVHSSTGQVVELSKEGSSIVIGRRSRTGSRLADLFIDDPYASRRHCRVFRDPELPDTWLLEDAGSNNGTRLNGVPVVAPTPVKEGMSIQVGTTRMTFSHEPQFVQRVLDADATVVDQSGEVASTLLFPSGPHTPPGLSTDATLVASSGGDPTQLDPTAMATTVVAGSPDSTLLDHTACVVPTEIQTEVEGTLVACGMERPISRIGDDTTSEMQVLQSAMSNSHVTHYWPTQAVSNLHRMSPLNISITSHMIQHFISANYLDDIQATELLEMAQKKGETFFRTLIESQSVQGILEKILGGVAEMFDLDYVRSQEKLAAQVVEAEWLPFSRAKELGCVLLKTDPHAVGTIRYGALDPFDVMLYDWVERCGQALPRPVLVHPEIFSTVLQGLKGKGNEGEGVGLSIDFTAQAEAHLRDQIQNVDVPQMVNYFLYRAHLQGASDIHIEPTEELLLVRLRVDGILHQEISLPMMFHAEMVSRLKILSGMDVVEKRRPQDGRLAVVIRNNPIDVRVSSYPTVFGEKFVLRLLDKNALRPSIETLGLMERDRRLLREKLAAPYGLVMISGPTGSGKTTTLYSCLGGMDRVKKNVLTVEDPVEYRMTGIHQMQVNHKIGLTFASGLRTILRQDPDVIMVGETRDSETAAMAIQASLTGHIVFSTIHTNDAVGVITRMLDMGIEPFLVSTALSLAVAQRLVRTICKHCRVPVSGRSILDQLQKDGTTKERLEFLGIQIDPNVEYTQGSGCSYCRDTGYHGRRAVFELFEMTDEARTLIMAGSINASNLKDLARKKGMTTLITHGIQLVEEEVTTFEEILRVLGEES